MLDRLEAGDEVERPGDVELCRVAGRERDAIVREMDARECQRLVERSTPIVSTAPASASSLVPAPGSARDVQHPAVVVGGRSR
ncbi:MAG: hypothetical protein ACXVZ4_06680 [Gaiellaceae bacterium]